MWKWITELFKKKEEIDIEMKYLIIGLGNIGAEYDDTRHNIGFDVVDVIAARNGAKWDVGRHAMYAEFKMKGKYVTLLKPTTFMNRSGNALSHWATQTKVKLDNVLIIVDDLHLDLGVIRLKLKGSDGGHNGLKDIARVVGNVKYPRLKVGIGKNFHSGQQVDYVLGKWKKSELKELPDIISRSSDAAESFISIGAPFTMEKFNKS